MLEAELEGRWFIGMGNHEVWGDPNIEGVLSAVPYLKKLGVTPENLIYKSDFKGIRFIFSGPGSTTIDHLRCGMGTDPNTRNR